MPRRAIILATLAMLSCSPNPTTITPTTVTFPLAYAGLTTTLPVTFTIGGTSPANATFTLPQDDDQVPWRVFNVIPQPQLNSASAILTMTPDGPGPIDYMLQVNVGWHGWLVAVHADAEPATCATQCAAFDATTGACDASNAIPCSTTVGACVLSAVSACVSDSTTVVSLAPVWTYNPQSQQPLAFGVFDSSGNQYMVTCPTNAGDQQCDLVAVSFHGAELWRQAGSIHSTTFNFFPPALVVGETLVLASSFVSPAIQARSLADGSLVWSRDDLVPFTVATLGGGTQLAIRNEGPSPQMPNAAPEGLILVDVASGAILDNKSNLPLGDIESIVSDGETAVWSLNESWDQDAGESSLALATVTGNAWESFTTTQYVPLASPYSDSQGLIGAVGQTIVTDRTAWEWPNTVAGFPAADTTSIAWLAVRSDGVPITLSFGAESCDSFAYGEISFFDIYTAALTARMAHCELDSLVQGLQLTQDGGAVFLMSTSAPGYELVVMSPLGVPEFVAQLGGLPASNYFETALIGNRWIMTGEAVPANDLETDGGGLVATPFSIAYDLPGVSAANHGWLTSGGSPLRQNAVQ